MISFLYPLECTVQLSKQVKLPAFLPLREQHPKFYKTLSVLFFSILTQSLYLPLRNAKFSCQTND